MATDDLSRSAFYPEKRYSGVGMQQGRVLTDDDWNEQELLLHEDKRQTRKDVIGNAGSPDKGFLIKNIDLSDGVDFAIKAGTFYLGGLRLKLANDQTFKLQSDWLQKPDVSVPAVERHDMVYLEVWQQKVSAVEDQELFEKALGGPDTTTRRRTMFRVKLAEDVDTNNCAEAWQKVITDLETNLGGEMKNKHALVSDAKLTVDYEDNGDNQDICSPSVLSGYLGAENQAIRVQLVDKDHFTWGFDNGAPLYRVTLEDAGSERKTIKFLTEPKDQAHWPVAGQIVEILPWSAVLENGEKLAEELIPGHFSKINNSYDPDTGEITLTTALPNNFGSQWQTRDDSTDLLKTRFETEDLDTDYYFLRVWNRGIDDTSNPLIPLGPQIKLGKTGLNITVEGEHPLPNDHWIIAARPHTPDQVVPWELELKRETTGYHRYYAPLAIIHWNAPNENNSIIYHCRKTFRPLVDLRCCCTFQVGDGVVSKGDFNSIEEAVRHLPEQGGCICVLPGFHRANLHVKNRKNIHILGCDDQSVVHPHQDQSSKPIFQFSTCRNVHIEHLTFFTITGTALHFDDLADSNLSSMGIIVEHNHILALTHAINIRLRILSAGKNAIRICHNNIGMWDLENGDVAIFSSADDVVIQDNEILLIAAPNQNDPNDPRDPDGPEGDPFDPCDDRTKYYDRRRWMHVLIFQTLNYLKQDWEYFRQEHTAKGGIQIAGGSELVYIIRNKIVGGAGNGITLGNVPTEGESGDQFAHGIYYDNLDARQRDYLNERFNAFIYEIIIENNLIANMGLSGIGVPAFFNLKNTGFMMAIEEATIRENHITHCAKQIPSNKPGSMLKEIGFGGIVLAFCEKTVISQNKIQQNGRSANQAICGVLVLYGEKIDVSDNRILDNGPLTADRGQDIERGLRGGIVVAMSFQQILHEMFQGNETFQPDGIPAVKVHNNIVTQPLGQSLFIITLGPVSVTGNQFTSQGADFHVNPYSIYAGVVLIFNLGVSQDLLAFLYISSYRNMAKANPATIRDIQTGSVNKMDDDVDVTYAKRLLYLPSGNVLFSNNQTTLDMRHQDIHFAFSSQMIVSLDAVTYNGNQSDCRSFIDILLTDVAILGVTILCTSNRFQEGFTLTKSSLFSVGFMNITTNNQATHCLYVYGSPSFTLEAGNSVLFNIDCPQEKDEIGTHLGYKKMLDQ